MRKLMFKPLTLAVSALGGVVAGAIFKKLWAAIANEEEAPKSDDFDRGWKEVVLAAVLQGAIFAGVKAILNRSTSKALNIPQ
jgi:hypothetical protein